MQAKTKLWIGMACSIAMLLLFSCNMKKAKSPWPQMHTKFDPSTLSLGKNNSVKQVHGQTLYLPVYSTIPYWGYERKFDLSAFVAIHNTDFANPIRVTKVLFFDNDGKLVANFLERDSVLRPLGATYFFVPEHDQSGTGANFIIEWSSDSLVNEPLVESVMIGLTGGQGVSFLSTGKVVRERR